MSDQASTETVEQSSQETSSIEQENARDPRREYLLCRVVDVESSLLMAFKRFSEEQKSSLEDMMNLVREELSKMELFMPNFSEENEETQG